MLGGEHLFEVFLIGPFDSAIEPQDDVAFPEEQGVIFFFGVGEDFIGRCFEIDPLRPVAEVAESGLALEVLLYCVDV